MLFYMLLYVLLFTLTCFVVSRMQLIHFKYRPRDPICNHPENSDHAEIQISELRAYMSSSSLLIGLKNNRQQILTEVLQHLSTAYSISRAQNFIEIHSNRANLPKVNLFLSHFFNRWPHVLPTVSLIALRPGAVYEDRMVMDNTKTAIHHIISLSPHCQLIPIGLQFISLTPLPLLEISTEGEKHGYNVMNKSEHPCLLLKIQTIKPKVLTDTLKKDSYVNRVTVWDKYITPVLEEILKR